MTMPFLFVSHRLFTTGGRRRERKALILFVKQAQTMKTRTVMLMKTVLPLLLVAGQVMPVDAANLRKGNTQVRTAALAWRGEFM